MELQWPLMIFTLFICLGAGTFGVTGLLAVLGKDEKVRFPALIVSSVSIVLGGIASALHLQHWERIFNGFGNLTSGITQELIGIVLIAIAIIIYFVLARKGSTPKWVGWVALATAVILVILMSHSYTMASRPLWNSFLLYGFYLANAIMLGGLMVMVLNGVKKEDSSIAAKIAIIGAGLQVIIILGYAILVPMLADSFASVGYYFDSTDPTKAMQDPSAAFAGFLVGEYALLFWGGALRSARYFTYWALLLSFFTRPLDQGGCSLL